MTPKVEIVDDEEARGVWRGSARLGLMIINFSFALPLKEPKEKLLRAALLHHYLTRKLSGSCPVCGQKLP